MSPSALIWFSHGQCDFSLAEREHSFNDHVTWDATGKRPEGDDLRGAQMDVGKRWTKPLRQDDPGHP
jgi:hypothetical protein